MTPTGRTLPPRPILFGRGKRFSARVENIAQAVLRPPLEPLSLKEAYFAKKYSGTKFFGQFEPFSVGLRVLWIGLDFLSISGEN